MSLSWLQFFFPNIVHSIGKLKRFSLLETNPSHALPLS